MPIPSALRFIVEPVWPVIVPVLLCCMIGLQQVNAQPTNSKAGVVDNQPGGSTLTLPRTVSKTVKPLVTSKPDTIQVRTHWAQLDVGVLASSTEQTPYWLQTNQFGSIPKELPAGLLIATMLSDYRNKQPKGLKLDWGYGVQVVGQGSAGSRVLLPEAYGKVRLGIFELWAGRRKQIVGLAESPLSSGSFIWSGNALPVPKVEFAIPVYWPLGFTRGWVSVKGSFSHGWFGKGTYVQNSYLHQKAIFIRLGTPRSRLRLYGAFTHQAQWAGYGPFSETDPTLSFQGQMANSVEAYMNVVVPLKSDALKNRAKFTTFDQNRVGDHRGTAEVALDVRFPHGLLMMYQQHFYDLGRKLYNLRNIEDGLYGLRYTNTRPKPLLAEVVVELFNSGNQGVLQFGKSLGGEWENYFINGQYPEGWSYRGRTLGTPFMSQGADVNPALPSIPFAGSTLNNESITGQYSISNNRIWALHGGATGNLGRWWGYQTKVTYSKNYGTFAAPFPANTTQLSGLFSLTKTMRRSVGSVLFASIGYDQGKLLKHPQQVGAYVGFRKTWVDLLP